MSRRAVRVRLMIGFCISALAVIAKPPAALAAGVVGTGTAASCTDDALHTALIGGGMVTFNCGAAPVTIDITSLPGAHGTETIAADTTIDGGNLITISGGNSVGVFYVNSVVNFTVQSLTIANGNNAGIDGGGIISYMGTLTVTNSTFSGNSAFRGGGISNYNGTLTVTNSTFSGNSAGVDGGGIYNANGRVTVTNSTFSGNSAYNAYGGGIYNDNGTLTVTNTIVTNSTSGGNCAGNAVIDGGHNIDDGTTCGFTGTGCTSTTGSSFCNTNPDLDPAGLQNNGGPTQTIALCTGSGTPASCTGASPAIDAGNEIVCSTTTGRAPVNNLDQRGFPRSFPSDPICDIGAFEVQRPAAVPGTAAPLVSPVGLLALVVLLSAAGCLALRRPLRR